ncbi:MAG: hypothetical protein ABFD70_01490 [Syntrophaceae bacterium]|nr:hypothetical protein [Deltaproteobacteria bacterium]
MRIDWFVLFAQIINFLVLVFLLKHFLYNRILGAMDTREARITAQFDEAGRLKEEAFESARAYQEKNRDLAERAEELLNQATRAAQNEKNQLMDEARQEVEVVRQRWHETLSREKKTFLEDLRRRSGTYIYDTIRHVLSDMADEDLESRMVRVFVGLIREMDREKQALLKEALKPGKAVIMVRSTFGLSPEQRGMIEEALRPYLALKASVRYETAEAIGAGIEMMVHGYKLSWSIEDYLASLEEKFVRVLKEEIRTEELV